MHLSEVRRRLYSSKKSARREMPSLPAEIIVCAASHVASCGDSQRLELGCTALFAAPPKSAVPRTPGTRFLTQAKESGKQ